MPTTEEISEEGFGDFRGTWWIGRVPLVEAKATLLAEAEMIHWLDGVASDPAEFEALAAAIEGQDPEYLPDVLRTSTVDSGLNRFIGAEEDPPPLDGLEIGVAALTHALSLIRCVTAASCRWHGGADSWSDCPVVLFAARAWRVEILAELIAEEDCGLGCDRDMLTVYGASIRDTHRLAQRILAERGRFQRMPARWKPAAPSVTNGSDQLDLLVDLH